MKKIFIPFIIAMAFILSTTVTQAQFNPYAEGVKMLTVGVGVSGWGIPVFGRFEAPVADNITVGGQLSYQSYGEGWVGGEWRHTIIGIQARGNYHFNELLELDNEAWDLYAGASLGYFIWNTTTGYSGNLGGVALGLQLGARYFLSQNIGLNLEFASGSVLSAGSLGVTFVF
jgi:outer membrane immunogenic protein